MNSNQRILLLFSILGYLLKFILVLIPIILIIYGTIDLLKYIISTDKNKESIKLFVKRLIYGVVAFFVVIIVTFIFNLLDENINNKYFKCFNNPGICNDVISILKDESNSSCSEIDNKDKCCKLLINNSAKYSEEIENCVIPISSLINK